MSSTLNPTPEPRTRHPSLKSTSPSVLHSCREHSFALHTSALMTLLLPDIDRKNPVMMHRARVLQSGDSQRVLVQVGAARSNDSALGRLPEDPR